jgi:phosphomannomutase
VFNCEWRLILTIKFGTDGWRAVISETFTFGNLRLVAQAIADYILEENGPEPSVVIGFDTRFLSDRYAAEVARVMAANHIQTWLARADTPTPAVSYAVVNKKATGTQARQCLADPTRFERTSPTNGKRGVNDVPPCSSKR